MTCQCWVDVFCHGFLQGYAESSVVLSCLNKPSLKYSQWRTWHWRRCIKAWLCSSPLPSCESPLCDAWPPLNQTALSGSCSTDMALFLCLCVFLTIVLALLARRLKLRMSAHGIQEPPRLPSLPVIGSLLSLWSPHPPHVLFKELQKKYGQTYSLMMGSHCVIIVNQHTHAKEVLLKKGKIFAGRPRTVGTPLLHCQWLHFLSSTYQLCFLLFHPCPLCDEGNYRCSHQRRERHRIWWLQSHLEIPPKNSPWSTMHVWGGLCLHRKDQWVQFTLHSFDILPLIQHEGYKLCALFGLQPRHLSLELACSLVVLPKQIVLVY